MSLSQSNLIQPQYGYDMVASITQKGLNNSIQTYYNDTHTFKAISYYFIKNTDGTPLQVDLSGITVNNASINFDPLCGTAKMPLTTTQINTVKASNLWFAYNMYIGNPAGDVQNYITINPGSNAIDYYLLCKTLHVVFWNPDNSSWVDVLQNTKEEFNINATVNLQTVTSNNNITTDVLNGVNYLMSTYNLSSTDLNIQQLLFDADSAVISPSSTLIQVDPNCSVFKPLMQQFAKSYFASYQAQAPALDYAVTQTNTSSLLPTSMSLFAGAFVDANGNAVTNPTKDQQDLATLNYLFSTDGSTVNSGKEFNWNFLDDNGKTSHNPDLDPNADVNKYDGAIAINRNAFAKYLDSQLKSYVMGNCWTPSITVGTNPELQYEYDVDINFDTYASNYGVQAFDENQIMGGSADTLVFYLHNGTASANGWAAGDTMTVNTHFYLLVDADALMQRLTISQALWISVVATGDKYFEGHTPYNGTPVNRTYSDTFSFTVDNTGNLGLTNIDSKATDTPDDPANIPQYVKDALSRWVAWTDAADFKELPVIMPKPFVFPGGNAFTFKDAQFSGTSDLVCHIKYLAEN